MALVKHKPLKRPRVYCRCYMIVRVISADNDNELAISWQVSNYWRTILIINHLSTHEQNKGINQKLINNQIKLKLHVCFYETKLGKHYAFSFITIKIIWHKNNENILHAAQLFILNSNNIITMYNLHFHMNYWNN